MSTTTQHFHGLAGPFAAALPGMGAGAPPIGVALGVPQAVIEDRRSRRRIRGVCIELSSGVVKSEG